MRFFAEMAAPNIAKALASADAPSAQNLSRSLGTEKYGEHVAIYTKAFGTFLRATKDKCSQVKTLLNQEAAVDLFDIYVNSRLTYLEGEPFADKTVLNNLKGGSHNLAVTGLAGSGKSMLMKWLALSLIESLSEHQKIPLFIEIRDLDFEAKDAVDLDELIYEYCSHPSSKKNIQQFRAGLKEGLFVVLLDGIDELPPEKIGGFLRGLAKFADNYRECSIVASARPGTQLTSLTKFFVYRVESLRLSDVIEVLRKAPYDEKRKEILITALNDGLYVTHKSFLSNPLLVTITLITFDDASRIPDNLTGFYAAAFDALFTRHDWSKGVFTRKRYSGLEKSDFERVFQYFCYQSYFRANYAFTRHEVIDLINDSMVLAGVNCDPEAYLKDCVVSVCLLLIEEPKITFVHRSFQEFFTARFAAGYLGEKATALLEWLAARNGTDNTFIMAAQLNRELLVRHWGLGRAREVRDLFLDWMARGEPSQILEYAGLSMVGCDLRTGRVKSFSGVESPGFGTLRAINVLVNDSPQSFNTGFGLEANAYGGKTFAQLDRKLQTLIRELTDDHQILRMSIGFSPQTDEGAELLLNLAQGLLDSLERGIATLEEFLQKRDEIANLVNLVHPWEAGKVTDI